MSSCTSRKTKADRKDLISCLMSAWAMDEPSVERTLSRTANAQGMSVDDLAESHVLGLDFVAELMRPAETASLSSR